MGWMFDATPLPIFPRNRLGARWVGPTAGLRGRGKSRPPLELDSQTFQPVASRYTT